MTDTTIDQDLLLMIRSVLRERDALERLDQSVDGVRFDHDLWKQLDELGLTRLTLPEAAGGSGAGWVEAAGLLREAGAAAVHLPLAESDLLAGWLLNRVGQPVDETPRTLAVLDANGRGRRVAWAAEVERVTVVRPDADRWTVVDLERDQLRTTRLPSSSGQPVYDVQLGEGAVVSSSAVEVAPEDVRTLHLRGALARAVSSVGAMERILEMCVEHTTVRVQFGRPLSRFQAVQQLVADLATEIALARSTVDAAVTEAAATDLTGPRSAYSVAVARSCVGHATSTVVRNAHQVHGAIGTTLEHPLQLFTQPLLDWRGDFGGVGFWDRLLGQAVRGEDVDTWDFVVGGHSADAVGRTLSGAGG